MTAEEKIQEYYELFTNNALKGEIYFVKFTKDSTVYVGIPMARSRMASGDDDTFTFKILEPQTKSGVVDRYFKDIEYVEKKV